MKAHKFVKTIPMKLYILLAAVIIFSFFSNDFGLVDIQKTAVILAAGIDKTEEGFSLTAQIAVPKGSDRTTGGTSSVEINAVGETVSDCVSLIFGETGWVPKLVFCNLIVLGEETVKEDIMHELNYFLRNEYMNDACKLAVCEGTAQELISSKSAIDDASSLAIEKLFSEASEKAGRSLPNSLKDFAIGYYGPSKSSYLPFVRMSAQKGSQSGGPAAGGSKGGVESSGGGQEKIYSAEETAIFQDGKMVGLLSHEQTLAYSLLEGNLDSGTFNTDDDGNPITLTILRNGGSVSLDMKGAPTVKLSLDITVRLCCRGTTAPIEDVASDKVSPQVLENAHQVLQKYVRELWDTCKACGCDLFDLKTSLYRSDLKKFAEWKEYLLSAVEPEIETNVKTMN